MRALVIIANTLPLFALGLAVGHWIGLGESRRRLAAISKMQDQTEALLAELQRELADLRVRNGKSPLVEMPN